MDLHITLINVTPQEGSRIHGNSPYSGVLRPPLRLLLTWLQIGCVASTSHPIASAAIEPGSIRLTFNNDSKMVVVVD